MADDPKVVLTPHEGGFIGLMHTGGSKIRTFVADSLEHAEDVVGSIGVGEFGMVQDDAKALAARVVQTFKDHSQAWEMAKAENAKLRAAVRTAQAAAAAAKADASAASVPPPKPNPKAAEA